MAATIAKPRLWSYRQAAEMFHLDPHHGYRTISDLVAAHRLQPVNIGGRGQGLDRADMEVLAKALNKTLDGSI